MVGFHFDEDLWDGTDVFRPEQTTLTFVTDPVAQALRGARLLNVHVPSFDEVEHLSIFVDGEMRSAPMRRPRRA